MNITDLPPARLNAVWIDEQTPRVLRLVKHARYAAAYGVRRGIASAIAVWQHDRAQRHESFDLRKAAEFLAEIAHLFPGMMQTWRPGPEPEELDWSMFRDPVTVFDACLDIAAKERM